MCQHSFVTNINEINKDKKLFSKVHNEKLTNFGELICLLKLLVLDQLIDFQGGSCNDL
jgi:hypothetical protein